MEDAIRQLVEACIKEEHRNPLWPDGIERFCATHSMTADQVADRFAMHVALEFAGGSLSYRDGDAAMNALFGAYEGLQGFGWEIFLAFDEGEFHHQGDSEDALPWQKYTLPLIMEALAKAAPRLA